MKNVTLISIIAGICGALMIIVFGTNYYVNTANNLTEMRNLAKKYESDIQRELQARFEKVPNLVEIVKGAAKHEEAIIDSITEARAQYNNAVASGDTSAMLEADTAINAALIVFQENYPEIAAMDLYKGLMDEYSGIEAAVSVARRNYNEVVMKYNNMIEHIPTSIIAESRGFERIPEFSASEEANNPIQIDMTN